jgi:serine/threonine-protein kinase
MTAADAKTIRDIKVKRCPDCGARFGIDAAFCPFDGIPLAASSWDPSRDALVGTTVDGRYEVHEPLGEGGMGTVYKVRHVTLNRAFAMKVLRHDLAMDAALAQRFVQEAKATAAIKNPGVVAISDFGVFGDGVPYFVMELLAGETLATRMRGRGPLPPRDAMAVARKIADALQASHDAGVIHRDLKPENVFLVGKMTGKSPEEEVRIVDFGAAKVVGGSKLTRPGVVFGTPYYMSPEQASGQVVDGRADVYSLGVLLYEMITGAVPFEADTYMGVLTKHMFVSPAKPSERVPTGIQLGELEGVIMKALEKEAQMRYQSMRELSAALEVAASKRASVRVRTERMPPQIHVAKPTTADRIERSVTKRVVEAERHRRNRLIVIGVVATAGTLVTGGVAVQIFAPKPSDEIKHELPVVASIPAVAAPQPSVSVPPPDPVASTSSSVPAPAVSSAITAVRIPPPPVVKPVVLPAPKPSASVKKPAIYDPDDPWLKQNR